MSTNEMIFTETPLKGAFVIEPERVEDKRGFFARSWSEKDFAERGLETHVAQCNISFNKKRGTLRGMHFQIAPFEEVKFLRCTRGSIHDVLIDLRPQSPTFKRHFEMVLSDANCKMLYIPAGFAHGFLTLDDDVEVFYQVSCLYSPDHARGVRWNDPAFGIEWPIEVRVISERDRSHPDFLA